MIRSCVTFLMFLLAVSFSTAYAETYTWTDEQGTIHFTEELGTVPKTIRKKARRVEEIEPSPAEKPATPEPSAKDPDATVNASASVGKGESAAVETYVGKTYDQWEKDLTDREAAMTAVRKRIDEIAALLNSSATSRDEQKKLLPEHKSLTVQFNEMKAEYYQQVEIARKAGLQVNIQQ
jgi:hypothetical protein